MHENGRMILVVQNVTHIRFFDHFHVTFTFSVGLDRKSNTLFYRLIFLEKRLNSQTAAVELQVIRSFRKNYSKNSLLFLQTDKEIL